MAGHAIEDMMGLDNWAIVQLIADSYIQRLTDVGYTPHQPVLYRSSSLSKPAQARVVVHGCTVSFLVGVNVLTQRLCAESHIATPRRSLSGRSEVCTVELAEPTSIDRLVETTVDAVRSFQRDYGELE